MDPRRILPYIAALLFLAFALGSLSRSKAGGSVLFQSYWLLYLLYLGPLIVLGVVAALIFYIARNWREISTGMGIRMATGRRKTRSRKEWIVFLVVWGIAIAVLYFRQQPKNATSALDAIKSQIVGEKASASAPSDPVQLAGGLATISNFFQLEWFTGLIGVLVVVCGLVLVQSFRVSLHEKSRMGTLSPKRIEGLQAVEYAIKLADNSDSDPRSRIMACYQELISSVSKLGAHISSDQTARQLEDNIRSTFSLNGPAIHDLTGIFEVARYSLHDITEGDASKAVTYLQSISDELHSQIDTKL